MAFRHLEGIAVGDKSPKSKQRDQKQKNAVKAQTKAKKDAVTSAGQVSAKKK